MYKMCLEQCLELCKHSTNFDVIFTAGSVSRCPFKGPPTLASKRKYSDGSGSDLRAPQKHGCGVFLRK